MRASSARRPSSFAGPHAATATADTSTAAMRDMRLRFMRLRLRKGRD
jgi:hypothetical protein